MDYFVRETDRKVINSGEKIRLHSDGCVNFAVLIFSGTNLLARGYTKGGHSVVLGSAFTSGLNIINNADLFRYIEVECTSGTSDLMLLSAWR